jgi:CheY-like chemotaxis protein
MFKVLIADDNFEDRDLLKMEVQQALTSEQTDIKFYEAASVKKTMELLVDNTFDLLTLDIEFDRLNEGIDALPEIFEKYPTLNIIIISGRLNKNEITSQLFRFTKDNVLKGKRWVRHFDVLDKKDNKKDALQRAYAFAFKQKEAAGKVRDMFVLAESLLEKNDVDKCIEVYKKIQDVAPGELESQENIKLLDGPVSREQVIKYMRSGDTIVASLLLGHYIEKQLKTFTRRQIGRAHATLSESLKELTGRNRISPNKKELFSKLIRIRNKAIHKPLAITDDIIDNVFNDLKLLQSKY